MKRAVLFDLDNTLYDYNEPHKKAIKRVYNFLKKEVKISFKEFDRLYELSKSEIKRELSGFASSHERILYFQRLVEKTHNTVEPAVILKLYSIYWDNILKNMKLRKGVLNTLKELKKRNLKIAIVSDLTTHIQLRKIDKLGITDYIDVLVTSEEAGSEKPHAIMFLLTLNKLKLLPEDVIYIGDELINDIEGGNAVGIDTVLIQSSSIKNLKEDYQKPKHIIKEIPEILNILNRLEYKRD